MGSNKKCQFCGGSSLIRNGKILEACPLCVNFKVKDWGAILLSGILMN